jgi:hypothetical protein
VKDLILISPVGLRTPHDSLQSKLNPLCYSSDVNLSPPLNSSTNASLPWYLQTMITAWNLNITPQSYVRVLGPRGKNNVKNILARRFSHNNKPSSPESSVNRGKHAVNTWTQEDVNLISEYLYHITVAPASGEYAVS